MVGGAGGGCNGPKSDGEEFATGILQMLQPQGVLQVSPNRSSLQKSRKGALVTVTDHHQGKKGRLSQLAKRHATLTMGKVSRGRGDGTQRWKARNAAARQSPLLHLFAAALGSADDNKDEIGAWIWKNTVS